MCFSLRWIEVFPVWLIAICPVVALLRPLIGFVTPKLGLGGEVLGFIANAITMVLWAIVCIVPVYFVFSLVMSLDPLMPRLPGP